MKIKSILTCGLGVLTLAACNDYLEVDSPSKYSIENVFSSQKDAGEALNGVYASILTNNVFGQAYTYSLVLNSDVDYVSNSREASNSNTPQRYDCDANSSTVNSVWNATWTAIENANNFIYNLKNGSIYNEKNTEVMQMMGEAKVIRAMLYYELMCYWGDVPFTLEPTSATEDFAPAIKSRDDIAKELIDDLAKIAPKMKFSSEISEGIERASKEACWAMIARIALQASGYSLRHGSGNPSEGEYGYMGKPTAADEAYFLDKARLYADSVIISGTHSLKKDYQQVFYDECNMQVASGDDPIFELPFAIEASGTIGYRQGPAFNSNAGETNFQWGECSGGQYLESFYRYSFADGDARKYVGEGFWYYDYQGTPILRASYGLHNLKWSKMWNTTNAYTKISTSNTGINYPYLRYADVLLMYAEADAKIDHAVNPLALSRYNEVRARAFRNATGGAPAVTITDEDSFIKAILNERKWEFAGENMRWKDLVRNNMLSETIYWTFMRNWAVAEDAGVGVSWGDNVENHDGVEYFDNNILPNSLAYIYIQNPAKNSLDLTYYQNTTLPCLFVLNKEATSTELKTTDGSGNQIHSAVIIKNNPQQWFDDYNLDYKAIKKPNDESVDKITWTEADFFNKWWDENAGYPQAAIRYSLYGYIRGGNAPGEYGNIYLNTNGTYSKINGGDILTDYPVIRYLLPIPREALRRGGYTNYYGY